jgi:hypothetical protein
MPGGDSLDDEATLRGRDEPPPAPLTDSGADPPIAPAGERLANHLYETARMVLGTRDRRHLANRLCGSMGLYVVDSPGVSSPELVSELTNLFNRFEAMQETVRSYYLAVPGGYTTLVMNDIGEIKQDLERLTGRVESLHSTLSKASTEPDFSPARVAMAEVKSELERLRQRVQPETNE